MHSLILLFALYAWLQHKFPQSGINKGIPTLILFLMTSFHATDNNLTQPSTVGLNAKVSASTHTWFVGAWEMLKIPQFGKSNSQLGTATTTTTRPMARWGWIHRFGFLVFFSISLCRLPLLLSSGAAGKGLGSQDPAATSRRGGLKVSALAVRHPRPRWNSSLRSSFRSEPCFFFVFLHRPGLEGWRGLESENVRTWRQESRVSRWLILSSSGQQLRHCCGCWLV